MWKTIIIIVIVVAMITIMVWLFAVLAKRMNYEQEEFNIIVENPAIQARSRSAILALPALLCNDFSSQFCSAGEMEVVGIFGGWPS